MPSLKKEEYDINKHDRHGFDASALTFVYCTVKPVLSGHSKRRRNIFFRTDYRKMQVKIILQYIRPSKYYQFVFMTLTTHLRQVLLYELSC